MIELANTIKRENSVSIGVISNEGRELTDYRVNKFELKNFVDIFLCSCYVHLRKPDGAIFQLARDITQCNPEETLYVDDRELYVCAAQGAGINGIVHKSARSTVASLTSRGLGV